MTELEERQIAMEQPLEDMLTLILVTSPVRSHPSTEMLELVLTSYVTGAALENCPKIIVSDGAIGREEGQKERQKQGRVPKEWLQPYEKFRDALDTLIEEANGNNDKDDNVDDEAKEEEDEEDEEEEKAAERLRKEGAHGENKPAPPESGQQEQQEQQEKITLLPSHACKEGGCCKENDVFSSPGMDQHEKAKALLLASCDGEQHERALLSDLSSEGGPEVLLPTVSNGSKLQDEKLLLHQKANIRGENGLEELGTTDNSEDVCDRDDGCADNACKNGEPHESFTQSRTPHQQRSPDQQQNSDQNHQQQQQQQQKQKLKQQNQRSESQSPSSLSSSWKQSGSFRNCRHLRMAAHQGFGGCTLAGLRRTSTPYVLILQHDRPLLRGFDASRVVRAMETSGARVKYVGLPTKASLARVNPEHVQKRCRIPLRDQDGDTDITEACQQENIVLKRLLFWYDSSHFCRTDFYLNFVFGEGRVARNGFPEDSLGQEMHREICAGAKDGSWKEVHRRYGTYLLVGSGDENEQDGQKGLANAVPMVGHMRGRRYVDDESAERQGWSRLPVQPIGSPQPA